MNFKESYSLSKLLIQADDTAVVYGSANGDGWKLGYVEVLSLGMDGKEKPPFGNGFWGVRGAKMG